MNISKVSSSQIEIIEKNNDYLSFYIKNNLVFYLFTLLFNFTTF